MERLGRYELGELLGEGGAGKVFRAVRVGPGALRKPVALKLLHHRPEALQREARIGGLLRHQGLVDVYEVGQQGEVWFCAMELCEGDLAHHGPLPPRAVVDVGLQVCAALQYAHEELGLVHLDLKPDNLLVTGGLVKVADLGIARASGFGGDGRVRGTRGYMAPEQAENGVVDARTDLYALGVTLVELATGVRPGVSKTVDWDSLPQSGDSATLSLDELDDAAVLPQPVPDGLIAAVGPCLEMNPDDRWPDMAALARALTALEAEGAALVQVLGPAGGSAVELAPAQDRFIGRTEELAWLAEQLGRPGLVAVRGPPGVGKSRLVRQAVGRWSGVVSRADCADARDLAGVVAATARAIGVPLNRGDPATRVGEALAARGRSVVWLDDLPAVGGLTPLLDRWVGLASRLTLVCTARHPVGEQALDLAPLALEVATELLVVRAQERGAEVADDPALERLAQQLDGLPLALELAAGRLGVLSVSEVLERLDLSLLRRSGDGRHGTLEAALAWGWEQLSEGARQAMAQLSVFEGGIALDAAEAVVESDDLLEVVGELVTGSWLRTSATERLSPLMPVAAWARAQLAATGETVAVEARHGAWFARVGRAVERAGLDGVGGTQRRRELGLELDNLLVASERAVARRDREVAADTALVAAALLQTLGPHGAAVEVLRAASSLELDPRRDHDVQQSLGLVLHLAGSSEASEQAYGVALDRARGLGDRAREGKDLVLLASLVMDLGALDRSAALLDQAQAALQLDPDRFEWAKLHNVRGSLAQRRGDLAGAVVCYSKSHHEAVSVASVRLQAMTLVNLGGVLRRMGRLEESRATYADALPLVRAAGDVRVEAGLLGNLANVEADLGDLEGSYAHTFDALQTYRRVGELRAVAILLTNLGQVCSESGRAEEALACFEEALPLSRDMGDVPIEAATVTALGNLCRAQGKLARARELLDHGKQLAEQLGSPIPRVTAYSDLGRLAAAEGDLGKAQAWLEQGLELLPDGSEEPFRASILSWLARPRAGQGALEAAWALQERAEACVGALEDPSRRADLALGLATLCWRAGDGPGARAQLAVARAAMPGDHVDLVAELDALAAEL